MAVLWLRFLTEINGKIRKAPPELEENPEVRKALEMVEVAALTPEERAKYDGFQDWLCRETRRADAERRLEELRKQDPEMVRLIEKASERDILLEERDSARVQRDAWADRLRDSARQMKADGMAVETIAKYTGLSAAEIASL